MPYDHALADRIRALTTKVPGLTEQAMFGGLAFLVNGRPGGRWCMRAADAPHWSSEALSPFADAFLPPPQKPTHAGSRSRPIATS